MSRIRSLPGRWLPVLVLLAALAGCGGGSSSSTSGATPAVPPANQNPAANYTISGTLTAAAGNAVDSDTNDPTAPYVANDSPQTAQALPNPVTLGGYVAAAPTGRAGDRFSDRADVADWYRVTLAAGQTINLSVSDHDGNAANLANPNLDLFLVDPNTQLDVQSSEGAGSRESITVATAGTYDLRVLAFSGGSNYTLVIGSAPAAVVPALRIEDDFIPGQVVVRFRQPAAGTVVPQAVTDRNASLGLVHRAGGAGQAQLFDLASPATQLGSAAVVAATAARNAGSADFQNRRATIDRVKELRLRSDVASADLNYRRRALLIPNDRDYGSQWNLPLINLPAAWSVTTGAASVVTAVVDTGVLMNHPDLAGRLCTAGDPCHGYDFVSDPAMAGDGDGIDPDPDDPGDQGGAAGSSSFHGTHVAGIVGAASDNGIGVAGVDWNTRIMPVRVLGIGGGSSYDVLQGVRYAAGLSNDSGTVPARPADIINLSLGGSGYSDTEQALFNQLHAAGIMVFAAAGNDATNAPDYPAAYAGVVAVSAVDAARNLASYSNYGSYIDVAAPGGDGPPGIISTWGDDSGGNIVYGYAGMVGTSMASPHLAGVAGLMLAVDPGLTATQFDQLLTAGSLTQDLGNDGPTVRNDSFGYGLIDAAKAVAAAQSLAGTTALPPTLTLAPAALDFGSTTTSLPVTVSLGGSGTATVTGVTASAPWIRSITLQSESPAGTGLGTYVVSVDRTGLAAGSYSGSVTFTTDQAGSQVLPVTLQVAGVTSGTTGRMHVELLDATTGATVQTAACTIDAGGSCAYALQGVPPGRYRVRAGTDMDHDGQVCDAGEACGSYPTGATPATVQVGTSDLVGINFTVGF